MESNPISEKTKKKLMTLSIESGHFEHQVFIDATHDGKKHSLFSTFWPYLLGLLMVAGYFVIK